MISIQGDVKEFGRYLDKVQSRVLPLAVPSAINKTLSQINTQARRAIAQDVGIAQKHFKSKMKLFRATKRKPSGRNWVGLKVKIPVAKVFTSQAKQVRYAKQHQSVNANELFMATTPSGHRGVFYRKPSAATKTGRDSKGRVKRNRLPIQEVMIDLTDAATRALAKFGPSITQAKFRKILAADIKYRLGKIKW